MIVFRHPTERDLSALVELDKLCFGWERGWTTYRLKRWLRDVDSTWLVGEDDGQVVAFAAAFVDTDEFGFPGFDITTIVVNPTHRGQGIGLSIVETLLRKIYAEGFHYVTLCLREGNKTAHDLYLRLGFHDVRLETWHQFQQPTENTIIMHKLL